jgi:K+-sensing histidine kinase KdpD
MNGVRDTLKLRLKNATPWSELRSYSMAVLFVGLATALTFLLWPYNSHAVYAVMFAAILLTARIENPRAGILAVVLGALAGTYCFVPPFYTGTQLKRLSESRSAF